MVRWRGRGEPNESLPSGFWRLVSAPFVFPAAVAVRGRLRSVCTWGSRRGAGDGNAGGGPRGDRPMFVWWVVRKPLGGLGSSVVGIEGWGGGDVVGHAGDRGG